MRARRRLASCFADMIRPRIIIPAKSMKRATDIVLAAIGLVLAAIPLLVLFVLIKRGSAGPAVFAQQRVGLKERPFRCYKLRTMTIDTPDRPTHLTDAAQITAIGRLLRATKVDELPQLWNVLRGDMSLVGPRPCLPSQADLIRERRALGVFELRPGVTGLAQIEGVDMSDPARLARKDAEYLGRQSLGLDIAIMVRTVLVALGGRRRRAEG
jgi:O-antigen biosynthesis protein WbqP